MKMKESLLVVPPNDPEAAMILELAKKLGLDTIVSRQPHGASLDREPNVLAKVKRAGRQQVVIVEMPGPKTEHLLRAAGYALHVIDHHHYTDLDRAHDPKTGRLLPSSLEQFLKWFRVTDTQLSSFGFDPKLVRGIGIMDRGFVWALRDEGYDEREIRHVLTFQKKLMGPRSRKAAEARKEQMAKRAWASRQIWNGYTLIVDKTAADLRPRLSLLIALRIKHPLPLILVEKKRDLIYVQESPHAMALFKKFGGFTFGMDRNWGYKNEKGKPRVSLEGVQQFLET